MLHTKFRGNRPVCSGEEDFFKDFNTTLGRGQEMTLTFNTHITS